MIVVLDIGKTLSKMSLWQSDGGLVARMSRPNSRPLAGGMPVLDVEGIEAWLADGLRRFAAHGPIDAIVPVAHGAAAAIVRDGVLVQPPLDYEAEFPAQETVAYARQRDPFAVTGSPLLGGGLNLGRQIDHLERFEPDILAGGAQILPWPQYWSWRLSGVATSEVTSLGCHSDLWRPAERCPSAMAERRGWAAHLAPLRAAHDAVGAVSEDWRVRTGIKGPAAVLCGIHDSNAALVAARGFAAIAEREATILSTGTWFVAMRSPAAGTRIAPSMLPEGRDCLINVDHQGRPIPSARFMGGRAIGALLDGDEPLDGDGQDEVIEALSAVGAGAPLIRDGAWLERPVAVAARRAAVALHAAREARGLLELIGTRDRVLIEGRFGRSQAFSRALATLRPDLRVFVADGEIDASFGGLRLAAPAARPATEPRLVRPLAEMAW